MSGCNNIPRAGRCTSLAFCCLNHQHVKVKGWLDGAQIWWRHGEPRLCWATIKASASTLPSDTWSTRKLAPEDCNICIHIHIHIHIYIYTHLSHYILSSSQPKKTTYHIYHEPVLQPGHWNLGDEMQWIRSFPWLFWVFHEMAAMARFHSFTIFTWPFCALPAFFRSPPPLQNLNLDFCSWHRNNWTKISSDIGRIM